MNKTLPVLASFSFWPTWQERDRGLYFFLPLEVSLSRREGIMKLHSAGASSLQTQSHLHTPHSHGVLNVHTLFWKIKKIKRHLFFSRSPLLRPTYELPTPSALLYVRQMKFPSLLLLSPVFLNRAHSLRNIRYVVRAVGVGRRCSISREQGEK